jgi:hypothetical protein
VCFSISKENHGPRCVLYFHRAFSVGQRPPLLSLSPPTEYTNDNGNYTLQGLGLTLDEFVVTMIAKLPRRNKEGEIELVANLIELFEQIDINGDGTMEWSEFTGYCVEVYPLFGSTCVCFFLFYDMTLTAVPSLHNVHQY